MEEVEEEGADVLTLRRKTHEEEVCPWLFGLVYLVVNCFHIRTKKRRTMPIG